VSESDQPDHPELSAATDGAVLAVHVQPGAKRPGFAGRHGDALRVRVSAPPADGRANDAVLALVASAFGLPRSGVRLLSGGANRRKRVLLAGVDVAAAAAVVERLLDGPGAQRS
jgi:uncharacterized protein (TIGR00251 family)